MPLPTRPYCKKKRGKELLGFLVMAPVRFTLAGRIGFIVQMAMERIRICCMSLEVWKLRSAELCLLQID